MYGAIPNLTMRIEFIACARLTGTWATLPIWHKLKRIINSSCIAQIGNCFATNYKILSSIIYKLVRFRVLLPVIDTVQFFTLQLTLWHRYCSFPV